MKALIFILGALQSFHSFSQNSTSAEVTTEEIPATKLYIENNGSHKQVEIMVGDILSYKKVGTSDDVKGKVTGFTSIRVSFENTQKESVTVLYKDLESLTIPRSPGRRRCGVTLIVLGGVGVIGGVGISSASGGGIGSSTVKSSGQGIAVGGFVVLVGGIILIQPRRINLQKLWVIKTATSAQL